MRALSAQWSQFLFIQPWNQTFPSIRIKRLFNQINWNKKHTHFAQDYKMVNKTFLSSINISVGKRVDFYRFIKMSLRHNVIKTIRIDSHSLKTEHIWKYCRQQLRQSVPIDPCNNFCLLSYAFQILTRHKSPYFEVILVHKFTF